MLIGREPLAQHPADQPPNDRSRAGPCRSDHHRRRGPSAANCSGHHARQQRGQSHPTRPPHAAHGAAGRGPLHGAHRHGECAGGARHRAWGPAHQPAHALRAQRRRRRQSPDPSHPGHLAHRAPAAGIRLRCRPGRDLEGFLPRRRRRLEGGHLDRPGQRHQAAGARRRAGGLPARRRPHLQRPRGAPRLGRLPAVHGDGHRLTSAAPGGDRRRPHPAVDPGVPLAQRGRRPARLRQHRRSPGRGDLDRGGDSPHDPGDLPQRHHTAGRLDDYGDLCGSLLRGPHRLRRPAALRRGGGHVLLRPAR